MSEAVAQGALVFITMLSVLLHVARIKVVRVMPRMRTRATLMGTA